MNGILQTAAKGKVLYVGPMVAGSTTVQRFSALEALGYEVHAVTTAGPTFNPRPTLLERVRTRVLGRRDDTGANERMLSELGTGQFDLVWIDKGVTIRPQTLKAARCLQPLCRIVGFSPDDMMNRANQSRWFVRGLPLHDFFVTTKSYNVAELEALGCPKVLFMENGFDPETHRPVPVSAADRERIGGALGFIGQWEPERAGSLRGLARAGLPVRVWGYTWERMKDVPGGLRLENRPLWGDDYARGI